MFPFSIFNPKLINLPRQTNAEKKLGHSCHHCRTHKREDFLVYCKNTTVSNSCSNFQYTKKCRRKFCHYCLRKYYNEYVYYKDGITKSFEEGIILEHSNDIENILTSAEVQYFDENWSNFDPEKQISTAPNPKDLEYCCTNKDLESCTNLGEWSCPSCKLSCKCKNCVIFQNSVKKVNSISLPYNISPDQQEPFDLKPNKKFASVKLLHNSNDDLTTYPNIEIQSSAYTINSMQLPNHSDLYRIKTPVYEMNPNPTPFNVNFHPSSPTINPGSINHLGKVVIPEPMRLVTIPAQTEHDRKRKSLVLIPKFNCQNYN